MATVIRPELSEKNKYYISKHRHYELKYFCLQYNNWKKEYNDLCNPNIPLIIRSLVRISNLPTDPTARRAMLRVYYAKKIELIERTARGADKYLYDYILKAVTENLSYTQLRMKYNIPCSRDTYYDRYRRFFWLLDMARE